MLLHLKDYVVLKAEMYRYTSQELYIGCKNCHQFSSSQVLWTTAVIKNKLASFLTYCTGNVVLLNV